MALIISGNRGLTDADRRRRLEQLYQPYHAACAALLAARANPVLIAVHSFTPQLRGRGRRPWHVGVLYSAQDARLSGPLIASLRSDGDLCVGENAPYNGHLPGDSVDRHALRSGRLNTLIEVRNDLIATGKGQAAWADRLTRHIKAAMTPYVE